LMRENDIPIIVFSIHEKGGLDSVMAGKGTSTIIKS
ncbi:MAG: UMP kinase, partial [Pseudomonadota bacterium]